MSDLPFIDEHRREVNGPPEVAWAAARIVATRMLDSKDPLPRWLLGVEPAMPAGPRPLDTDSEGPGFRVVDAVRGERLTLEGRHRFSRYRLEFLIEPSPTGSRVAARSYAEFPGVRGRIYRALVIQSRGHVLAVQWLLRSIDRAARKA